MIKISLMEIVMRLIETKSGNASWAENAPWRLSMDASTIWKEGLPLPTMAEDVRRTSDGRLMLAFHIPEVRDYFLDAFEDQGARIEPDGAVDCAPISLLKAVNPFERASKAYQETRRTLFPEQEDLLRDRILVRREQLVREKEVGLNKASSDILRLFNFRILQRLRAGDLVAAEALRGAMPLGPFRDEAFEQIMSALKVLRQPMPEVKPARLDREQALALRTFQRATRDLEKLREMIAASRLQKRPSGSRQDIRC